MSAYLQGYEQDAILHDSNDLSMDLTLLHQLLLELIRDLNVQYMYVI